MNLLLFQTLFRMALRNALVNWRHSLAALLSIASGFAALTLFQGYILEIIEMYDETFTRRGMLGHVLIEREGANGRSLALGPAYDLQPSDQAVIDEFLARPEARVRNRVRFLHLSGTATNGRTNAIFAGYGYDAKEGARMRAPSWSWNTVAGVPLDQAPTPDSVIFGLSLGAILDCYPEKEMHIMSGVGGYRAENRPFRCGSTALQLSTSTVDGRANAESPSLAGLTDAAFKDIDTKFVSMPLELAQSLKGTKAVSYYSVELADPSEIPAFAARLKAAARAKGLALDVTPWQKHRFGELFVRTLDFLSIFRNFILLVILAIVTLSVLNTIVKLILERTREVGTLRSIGFDKSHVIWMFAIEATVLGLAGCLIGAAAALLIIPAVNAIQFPYQVGMLSEPIPFRLGKSLSLYLQCGAILWLIAIGSALVPAFKVAAKRIPSALEHA